MRKLILLGLVVWLAKKLSEQSRGELQTPFPTSSRPPEGYGSA